MPNRQQNNKSFGNKISRGVSQALTPNSAATGNTTISSGIDNLTDVIASAIYTANTGQILSGSKIDAKQIGSKLQSKIQTKYSPVQAYKATVESYEILKNTTGDISAELKTTISAVGYLSTIQDNIIEFVEYIKNKLDNIQLEKESVTSNISPVNNQNDNNKNTTQNIGLTINNVNQLSEFIKQLQTLNLDKLDNNLYGLTSIINTIIEITENKKLANLNSNNSLKNAASIINTFINSISVENDKAINIKLDGINQLIDSIIKISEMGWIQRKKIELSLGFTTDIINVGLKGIIESISNSLNKNDIINAKSAIYTLEDLIDFIFKVSNIGIIKYFKAVLGIELVKELIDNNISILLEHASNINKDINNAKKSINNLSYVLTDIQSLININQSDIAKSATTINYINSKLFGEKEGLKTLIDSISAITIGEDFSKKLEYIESSVKDISNIAKIFSGIAILLPFLIVGVAATKIIIKGITNLVKALSSINTKDITSSKENVKSIMILLGSSAAILLAGGFLITTHLQNIIGGLVFAAILDGFIYFLLKTLSGKTVNKETIDAMKNVTGLCTLLVVSGAMLLLGGLILQTNKNLILYSFGFAFMLGAFLYGIIHILKSGAEKVAMSIGHILALTGLIVVSGALLILGGMILEDNMKLIWGSIKFAGMLALFLGSVIFIFRKAAEKVAMSVGQILAVTGLVVLSGALLLLGGLILAQNKNMIEGTAIFTGLLAGFFLAISAAFSLISIGEIGKNYSKAIAFGLLIIATASVLTAATYASTKLDLLSGKGQLTLLIFAIDTLAFMGMMLFGLKAMSPLLNQQNLSMNIKNIAMLSAVVTLSGLLLMGAAYVASNDPKIFTKAMSFCILLLGFSLAMWGVSKVLNQIGGEVKKSLLTLFGIVAVIGTFALIIEYLDNTLVKIGKGNAGMGVLYSLGELAFVVGTLAIFTALLYGLGNIVPMVGLGVAGALGINLVIATTALALSYLHDKIQEIGDIGKFFTDGMMLVGTFAAIGGALILAGIAGITAALALPGILLVSTEILTMSGSMLLLKKSMEGIEPKSFKTNVNSFVDAFISVGDSLAESKLILPWYWAAILMASQSVGRIGRVISKIAAGVKDYATLTIPIYDGTKKVGYRQLNESDFQSAAENVKTIVSVLGNAILEIYQKNPDMFRWELIGDNPFVSVVNSCSMLGSMISKIASGVKDYANMTITTYDSNGKANGKMLMDDSMYDRASTNIGKVIKLLSQSIMNVYNSDPSMFEDPFIGDSPFNMVLQSCTKIGDMISSIAKGVKDYASLQIADQWDKNGKPIHFMPFDDSMYTSAADNISMMIVGDKNGKTKWQGLSGTIAKIYNDYKKDFSDDDSVKALFESMQKGVEFLNNTVNIVSGIAQLKLPLTDNNGIIQKDKYKIMDTNDYIAAADTIRNLILGDDGQWKGIMGTVNSIIEEANSKDIDEDRLANMEAYIKSMATTTDFLNKVIKVVQDYAQLKIPVTVNGVIQKDQYKIMDELDFQKATQTIRNLMLGDNKPGGWEGITTTVNSIITEAIANAPEAETQAKIDAYLKSCLTVTTFLEKISGIIQTYASFRIPAIINGKVDKEHVTELTQKDFIKVKDTIRDIISGDKSIGFYGIVGTTMAYLSEQANKYQNSSSIIKSYIDKSVNPVLEMISKMSDVIKTYASNTYKGSDGKEYRMTDTVYLNASQNIIKMLLGSTNGKSKGIISEIIDKITNITVKPEIIQQYVSAFNSIISIIQPMGAALQGFANMKLNTYDNKGNITKSIDLSTIDFSSISTNMSIIIDSAIALAKKISDNSIANQFIILSNKAKDINPGISSFGNIASNIWGAYGGILQTMNTYGINNGIASWRINYLKNLLIGSNEIGSEYTEGMLGVMRILSEFNNTSFDKAAIQEMTNSITDITKSIKDIASVTDENTKITPKSYDNFMTNLAKINKSIGEISPTSVENFKSENAQIDIFVKKINSLQLNKINAIKDLANSMYKLTNKFGSLDRLVQALSTDMNAALVKLVAALVEAKETINKTEEIQNARHAKIDASIKLIQELMKQQMVVKIEQENLMATTSGNGLSNGDNTNQ